MTEGGVLMERAKQERYLSLALKVVGVISVAGLPLMMMVVWPAAWSWERFQTRFLPVILPPEIKVK